MTDLEVVPGEPMPPTDAARMAFEGMADAHDLKLYEKVVTLGDAWIAARGEMPGLAMVWYAQGLMAQYRLEDALLMAGFATDALKDSHPIAYCAALAAYGQALARTGDFAEARRQLKIMATLTGTDDGETMEKQGHTLLAISSQWAKGWRMTEGRLKSPGRGLPEQVRPWDGVTREPVAVLHEQGIGDALLIARWLPWVAKVTGHPVTWYGPELLHDWMAGLPNVRVGALSDLERVTTAACYAMSLPSLSGVQRPSDVPPPVAPHDLLTARRFHHPRRGHIRVGVCWKGSAGGWHDFERSFPYEEMAPVWAACEGVEFVNLAHEAAVPNDAPFVAVKFGSILASAHGVAGCDLVVSVDTSIVHLAGSLGVPTLAIVPTVPDWRYTWPHGGTTPFYPSVTVLRKKHMLDLGVVEKARALVEKYAQALNQRVA